MIRKFVSNSDQSIKTPIYSQEDLVEQIEKILDSNFNGVRSLFALNEVICGEEDWMIFLYSYINERFILGIFDEYNICQSISDLKDKYRGSILLKLAKDHVYDRGIFPSSAVELVDLLTQAKVYLEVADTQVIHNIFSTNGRFAQIDLDVKDRCRWRSNKDRIAVTMDPHE